LNDSATSAVDQVRRDAIVAPSILQGRFSVTAVQDQLLSRLNTGESETVALVGRRAVGSIAHTPGQVPNDLVDLVGRGDVGYERTTIANTPYLIAGAPLPGRRVALFTFVPEGDLFHDLSVLGLILLAGWAAVVVLAGLVGSLLARRTLAPVARASDAARSLAEGLLETRLPQGGNDEFGAWAASFNQMAEALEAKVAALQEARERERRFTSDVSHELRTPLTALVSEASMLREHLGHMPQDVRRPAEMLVRDVARLRRLVDDLMEISRLDAGGSATRLEPVDVRSLVEAVIRARGWDGRVSVAVPELLLRTDRRRAERVLSNLIGNALEHGGREVAVRAGTDALGAFIEVSDRGSGILPEDLPHLFERFYKTDPSRSSPGSGLGLAIASENARLLGGDIEVWSEVGTGTRFTVRLPVTEPLRHGEPAVAGDVDDDDSIRRGKGGAT